jgi:hypothetical protein
MLCVSVIKSQHCQVKWSQVKSSGVKSSQAKLDSKVKNVSQPLGLLELIPKIMWNSRQAFDDKFKHFFPSFVAFDVTFSLQHHSEFFMLLAAKVCL